jgi:dihydroxycyclohexadiene carboxylate dehydrogenase
LLLIDRSRYVHELAATLAEGSDVLALEADLEQWESTEQALPPGSPILADWTW